MTRSTAILSLFLLAGASANAAIIFQDGFNFLDASAPPGHITRVAPNTITTLAGHTWNVTAGSIDWIGGTWVHQEGDGSLDMAGNGSNGVISIVVPTVAGQPYSISFYIAGNPAGGETIKDLNVSIGTLNSNYTFDITGHSLASMGWTLIQAGFVANVNNEVLTFTSLEPLGDSFGPALDLVTIAAVPEPGSFILGGLGFVGLLLLRRRKCSAS